MYAAKNFGGHARASGATTSKGAPIATTQSRPEGLKRKAPPSSPTPASVEVSRASSDSVSRDSAPARKSARRCRERLQGESDDESDDASMYDGGRMYKLHIPSTLPTCIPPPPTKTVPCAKGYRFTEEDQKFFVNMILWQTKLDGNVSKRTITEALHARVRRLYGRK